MGSLQDELKKHYPEAKPAEPQPPPKPKYPPYSRLDIPATYKKFCSDMVGKDYVDPRDTTISILEVNFPKLLGAKMAANGSKARATPFLKSLKDGTFNPALFTVEKDRTATIFWIEETICQCDSIHDVAHKVIEADEVYVKKYDKEGAPYKLVFTRTIDFAQIIVVTSFLTDESELPRFIKMPAKWP
jgi:hypothetical protein